MDSIGDYFYLIILVIAALSGLLKKKKQSLNANPGPSAPAKPTRSWEEVLRDLVPVEVEEEEIEKPIMQKMKPVEPAPSFNYKNEGTSSLRGTKQVSQLISQKRHTDITDETEETYEQGNILQEIQLSSIHDAKRAFIYSEIFNRKY